MGFYDDTNYPFGNYFRCTQYGGSIGCGAGGDEPPNGFVVVRGDTQPTNFYVDAGPDRVVTLDWNSIQLTASITEVTVDDFNTPFSFVWESIGDENLQQNSGVCSDLNEGNQCMTFGTPSVPGQYTFTVSVYDSNGWLLGSDTVDIDFTEYSSRTRSTTKSSYNSRKLTKIDKYGRKHYKKRKVSKYKPKIREYSFGSECPDCDYYMGGTLSGLYQCGNFNGDTGLNVLDLVGMVNFVLDNASSLNECDTYLHSPFPVKCLKLFMDMNNDGVVNILDVVSLVNVVLGHSEGIQQCGMVYYNSSFSCCDGTYVNHEDLCVFHGGSAPCDSLGQEADNLR